MIKQNYVGFKTLSPIKVLDKHHLPLQCKLVILTLIALKAMYSIGGNSSSPKTVLQKTKHILFYIMYDSIA